MKYEIWENYIKEQQLWEGLHEQLKQSWKASFDAKVPSLSAREVKPRFGLTEQLFQVHQGAVQIAQAHLEKIGNILGLQASYAAFLTDGEGYLLSAKSNWEEKQQSKLGIRPGACWQLTRRGTTAVALALLYPDPIMVEGPEHYQKRYHAYTSLALPVRDIGGKLLYVLCILVSTEQVPKNLYSVLAAGAQEISLDLQQMAHFKEIGLLHKSLEEQTFQYGIQSSLLKHLFDHTSDPIIVVDEAGKLNFINNAGKAIMDQVKGNTLADIRRDYTVTDFSGKPILLRDNICESRLWGKTLHNIEICLSRQGAFQYFYLDAIPFKDQADQNFSICILKDVTDFIQLEAMRDQYKLKAEEMANIINTISEGVAIVNPEGKFILMNPACQAIFEVAAWHQKEEGCQPTMLMNYAQVYDEKGNLLAKEEVPTWQVLQGKRVEKSMLRIEFPHCSKYLSFSGVPIFEKSGAVRYAVFSYSDLTDLKEQQHLLYQNSQFLNNMMESLGVPVVVISYPDCVFHMVNSMYCKLLEEITGKRYREEELAGKDFFAVLDGDLAESSREAARKIAEGEESNEIQTLVFQDAQGKEKYLQVVYTPVLGQDGRIEYITAVGVDITFQIQARREVERLSLMKEEYLSLVSHELRSPLAVVHSAVQLLTGKYYEHEMSQSGLKILKKVEKNTYNLLRMVNNLLDMAKAEAGYTSVNSCYVDMRKLTESMLESVQPIVQHKNIQLISELPPNQLIVSLDPEKYERILLNLLSNAIKFTPVGGSICVSLAVKENRVVVSVKDSGIGIPKDRQSKIFNRYYMIDDTPYRKSEGTGIGLSLVRSFVDMMKGEIFLVSEENQGAEFIVAFPYQPDLMPQELEYTLEDSRLKEKVFTEFSDIKNA